MEHCVVCGESCRQSLHEFETHLDTYDSFLGHIADFTLKPFSLDYTMLVSFLMFDGCHVCYQCIESGDFESSIYNPRVIFPYMSMIEKAELHIELKQYIQKHKINHLKRKFPDDIVHVILTHGIN